MNAPQGSGGTPYWPPSGRPDITRIVLMVLAIGMLIAGSFWILRPFLPALIWATTIVVATWPVMKKVEHVLWNRRGLAVTVMTSGFLLLVIVPITLAIASLVGYVPELGEHVKDLSTFTVPPPPDWVAHLPLVGERIAAEWQNLVTQGPGRLAGQLAPYAKVVSAWLLAEAGSVGMLALQLLLTIVLTAVLYAYGETAARGVTRFVERLGGERGALTVELAGGAIRAVALGIIVTALVQTVLAGVGLAAAGVPYAGVLTAITFLFCVAQIGPSLVLFPAVGWLYWKDATLAATLLLVWSIGVSTLDNVLRPVLIRRGADLPLLLIMSGVIGGLLAFGILGLFVGPVVLAVTYTLLVAWIEERPGASAAEAAPSDTNRR